MYWKVWIVYMTDKIWFLRRGGSEATHRSIDCSYWLVVGPIFTLNMRHKFPNQLHWVNKPLATHKFDFKQHSSYRFGTCIMMVTGHWDFSPWTTLSDTPIQRLEPQRSPPPFIVVPTPVSALVKYRSSVLLTDRSSGEADFTDARILSCVPMVGMDCAQWRISSPLLHKKKQKLIPSEGSCFTALHTSYGILLYTIHQVQV